MDRNQLEQQALQHLNRGDPEAALKTYLALLKTDPKDARIRQKVGDLFVRTGRPHDAERTWRELADQLIAAGNHRQAVAIVKQLVSLRPEEAKYHFDLGECYVASGYPNEARQHLEMALKIDASAGRPVDAVRAARRLAELSPGDLPTRLRLGELLEAAGDRHGAGRMYQEVMDEFRRRGRHDEVGRVAELALRISPEDPGLLLDAAAARVEAGDHKRALVHLHAAFPAVGKEPRTLDLLARAFEGQGQADKAQKVLAELEKAARAAGDVAVETDALRRAARLSPADAEIAARLGSAEERLKRREQRLTTLALAQPSSEDELRPVVRAEVYARYGFPDRAERVLQDALALRSDATSLIAAMAEVLAQMGRAEDAVRWTERLVPLAGAEVGSVIDRIAVLKGGAPAHEAPAPIPVARPAAPAPAPASPTAPTAAPSPAARAEGPLARGERLAAAGDVQGALLAFREALAADPMDEAVLGRIAALRSQAHAAPAPVRPAPAFEPIDEGTFAEVSPDEILPHEEIDDVAPADAGGDVDEGRALLAVGRHAQALAVLRPCSGLEARVLEAQALAASGDAARAVEVLRNATNDAAEDDPAYAEGLFTLAGLYIHTGRHRPALRLVEELLDLHPDYRTVDTLARQRGLSRLLAGG